MYRLFATEQPLNIHTVIGHAQKSSFCDNVPLIAGHETPCDNLPRFSLHLTISKRHPASHSVCKHTLDDISQDSDYKLLFCESWFWPRSRALCHGIPVWWRSGWTGVLCYPTLAGPLHQYPLKIERQCVIKHLSLSPAPTDGQSEAVLHTMATGNCFRYLVRATIDHLRGVIFQSLYLLMKPSEMPIPRQHFWAS